MIQENFIQLYENSFRANWDLPALTNYGEKETWTYADVARHIARLHILFEAYDIRQGDKIALIGKDSIHWCVVYMAAVTYGAVIVPILSDFNPNDLQHIVNHSESRLLFVGERHWETLDEEKMPELQAVFSLGDFRPLSQKKSNAIQEEELNALFVRRYPDGFRKEHINYAKRDNDQVVLLNYTSGTTGFSKGVMLTGNNLAGNVTYARTLDILFRGERELCFLPLAHAYSCAFNFLVPMAFGAHVYLLGKLPSPKILLKAFADVKPHLILTVPLILEKIYKKILLPVLSKRSVRIIRKIPGVNRLFYRRIRQRLSEALGGNFREVIVGGAAMNQEVADFLYQIRFPFTIGYGMTECGPLISYDNHRDYVLTSCGQILKGIMQVRIDSENPYHQVGEIQVRGENVMRG